MHWHSIFFSPITWNNSMNLNKNLDLLLSVFFFLWNYHIYFLQKGIIQLQLGEFVQRHSWNSHIPKQALSTWFTELTQMPWCKKNASKPVEQPVFNHQKDSFLTIPNYLLLICLSLHALPVGYSQGKRLSSQYRISIIKPFIIYGWSNELRHINIPQESRLYINLELRLGIDLQK